jgi:nucleolar protein 58
LKLKSFQKFDSATTALEEVTALLEGKVTPRLASLLNEIKDEKKVSLAVADPKLGKSTFWIQWIATVGSNCMF